MHEDHRQRVRERFLKGGLAGWPAHNVLEFLLFYSIPRRDTNETAHRLTDTFGSLAGVLNAPAEELQRVEGVGENTAALIKLCAELSKLYITEQAAEKADFANAEEFKNYALTLFTGTTQELAYLIGLNNAGQLLQSAQISLGTKYAVALDNRTLLETAFRLGATQVVLAHNHPNGVAAPSQQDVQRTKAAAKLFGEVNIRLLDHFIVGGGTCFSMVGHPKFGLIFLGDVVAINQQMAADVINSQ